MAAKDAFERGCEHLALTGLSSVRLHQMTIRAQHVLTCFFAGPRDDLLRFPMIGVRFRA
jgi:hypothetical protein